MNWKNLEWIYSLFDRIEKPNYEQSMMVLSLTVAEMDSTESFTKEYDQAIHDLYRMQ